MRELDESSALERQAEKSVADMRGAQRFALMLRSAKLLADGTDYLCIIRDVSETGVKLRFFHALPAADTLMLELSSGERYPVETVWIANNEAGFRFIRRIDVDAFMSEAGPYPKRSLRLCVHHPAQVRFGNETFHVTILDLSRQGARIACHSRLAIGQKFWLEARELPLFDATICWRREPEYGVVFGQLMGLDELAQRASRMVRAPLPA